MEELRQWAQTLAGLVVLGSACEMVLPESNFRKYIRLTVGMILVLHLLSPLPSVLRQEWSLKDFPVSGQTAENITGMEDTQSEQVIRIYLDTLNTRVKQSLSARIAEPILSVACRADAETDGNFGTVTAVSVTIDGVRTEETLQTVQNILRQEYGVASNLVSVRFSKE